MISTAIVALFSGVIATSLFLYSRHQATKAYEVAAVDATQAGETIFTLMGEVLFLGVALPGLVGWIGLFLIIIGLVIYSIKQAE